jgi:energy-coupling factor transporter ATP-binding protein EcfA2
VRLSGGERQRIALARAFLKDAPILILDEPTSSVDTRTEAEILEAMKRLMRGRTTFLIAHRASTLKNCDARLEVEHGRVAVTPSHGCWAPRPLRSAAGAEKPGAGAPARHGRNHGPVRRPADHPAVGAWKTIAPTSRVDRVDCLRVHKRAQIYRLALGDGTSVIAKRGHSEAVVLERTIYDGVLPRLPSPALRSLGVADDSDEEFAWLFLEDAGDHRCSLAQHGRLAARWLGTLHGVTAHLDLAPSLPERGPGHYLEHLRAARGAILDSFGNPALSADDRDMLRELLVSYDLIESGWSGIEAICANLPRTFIHGDLVARNLRLRCEDTCSAIVAFGWEWSGFGVPAADIYQLAADASREDLSCYRSTLSEYVGGIDDGELRALLLMGNGFRLLAAVDWASTYLPHPWPEKGVATLRLYERPLRTWAAALESADRAGRPGMNHHSVQQKGSLR